MARAPGDMPVTVNGSSPFDAVPTLTVPLPEVTVAESQTKVASKLVTFTVNPSGVEVGNPNVGVYARPKGLAWVVVE